METTTTTPQTEVAKRIPEILAPAGGRAQFLAALNTGADAVYLGLKQFNARARAENFTFEDLEELIPLAHRFGMQVLVTMNVLIKENELAQLLQTLAKLEALQVDAIIVQDLGLCHIVRQYFPRLRMHASTQMAIHNIHGVMQAMEWGFKRVVLARELTAVELKRIRNAVARDAVEIEAFCHGSLCYSYSGLCFFSGTEDGRSGNRGECAYTCREPYKIISEPGQGFLFSMRDLDTADSLNKFIEADVDTLKIEGRKKDAQYVASVVKLYRIKLNEAFKSNTLRSSAPPAAKALYLDESEQVVRSDLALSFQRRGTSLFLNNRYKENVIDLDNPTHHGLLLGTVAAVSIDQKNSRWLKVKIQTSLQRFDGVSIRSSEKANHSTLKQRYDNAEIAFPVREMKSEQSSAIYTAEPGDTIWLKISEETRDSIVVGMEVRKLRSSALKEKVAALAQIPADTRLRREKNFQLRLSIIRKSPVEVAVIAHFDGSDEFFELSAPFIAATDTIALAVRLEKEFAVIGPRIGEPNQWYYVGQDFVLQNEAHTYLEPRIIKTIKQKMREFLTERDTLNSARLPINIDNRHVTTQSLDVDPSTFSVKSDSLATLLTIASFSDDYPVTELIWEPKRSDLIKSSPESCVEAIAAAIKNTRLSLRMALPTVIRAWDELLLKRAVKAFYDRGFNAFELGNLGGKALLRQHGVDLDRCQLTSDFSLYALNSAAADFLSLAGMTEIALSIEDDRTNLHAVLDNWKNAAKPLVILYKDTPLFIAEACSLTALHNGCPTAKVCGYRSLEIENSKGERFLVTHDGCKSVVFGKQAFSLSEQRSWFEEQGVRRFRIDFMHREYHEESLRTVIRGVMNSSRLEQTHSANFLGTLL